jgi:glycosyltransferase involved in cell wall biosynthesis
MTTAPPTIAVLGTLPPLRGLSSYCYEFALAMAGHHAIDFISFKKLYPAFLYPGGELKEDATFPPIRHRQLTVRRTLAWNNPAGWVREGFSQRADLLHAQWWSLPLAPIYAVICAGFKMRGKPVVVTVHNVVAHERDRAFRLVSGLLYRLADHFIVHTRANADQLQDRFGIGPEQISTIAHGPLDFHVRKNVDRHAVRRRMGFAPNHRVILLFGAIRPYKGIDTAIDAVARVLASNPDARLLIAGKPWESWAPYAARIEALGIGPEVAAHLRYIPSGEVHRFFTAADLVVLPYHHFESQSGAGSVALSFGKPMIVTDVGGLPDLVADHRWIVPPRNAPALARAINHCLDRPDRLSAMARNAEAAARRAAWPAIAKRTALVYKNLLRP